MSPPAETSKQMPKAPHANDPPPPWEGMTLQGDEVRYHAWTQTAKHCYTTQADCLHCPVFRHYQRRWQSPSRPCEMPRAVAILLNLFGPPQAPKALTAKDGEPYEADILAILKHFKTPQARNTFYQRWAQLRESDVSTPSLAVLAIALESLVERGQIEAVRVKGRAQTYYQLPEATNHGANRAD